MTASMLAYGQATLEMVQNMLDSGVERGALLMRHSARTYHRDIHDLENQLTEEGRQYASALGEALPSGLRIRGYASPPTRCQETASRVLDAYAQGGGEVIPVRPVESLGVFYALDQMKLWKNLQAADGLTDWVARWGKGQVPKDAVIPADQAAQLLVGALHARFLTAPDGPHLDLCVSHDMSVLLVRDQLVGIPAEHHEVEYLDAILLYEQDGEVWLQSHHGPRQSVSRFLQ